MPGDSLSSGILALMGHFKKLKAWQHARALALVSKPLIASLDEIEAIIDLAVGLDYLRGDDVTNVNAVRDECARTVYGLMRKLGEHPQ
jgi:hypothetical protein